MNTYVHTATDSYRTWWWGDGLAGYSYHGCGQPERYNEQRDVDRIPVDHRRINRGNGYHGYGSAGGVQARVKRRYQL